MRFASVVAVLFTIAVVNSQFCSSLGDFSGFRVFQVDSVSLYPLKRTHHIMLCKCKNGKISRLKSFEIDSTGSFFNHELCFETNDPKVSTFGTQSLNKPTTLALAPIFGKKLANLFKYGNPNSRDSIDTEIVRPIRTCYKLARRRLYASLNLRFFLPITFVGNIFACETRNSGTCHIDQFENVGILIADDPRGHWYGSSLNPTTFNHFTPCLRTPTKWENKTHFSLILGQLTRLEVNVEEMYNYSQRERAIIAKILAQSQKLAKGTTNLLLLETPISRRTKAPVDVAAQFKDIPNLPTIGKLQKLWDEKSF